MLLKSFQKVDEQTGNMESWIRAESLSHRERHPLNEEKMMDYCVKESQADIMLLNLEVAVPQSEQDTNTTCHNVDKAINRTNNSSAMPVIPSLTPRKSAVNSRFGDWSGGIESVESYQNKEDTAEPYLPLEMSQTSRHTAANRFADAQRDRTLRHHKLLQPTPAQERAHLSSLGGEYLLGRTDSSIFSLQTLLEEESDDEIELDLKQMYTCEDAEGSKRNHIACDARRLSTQSSIGGDRSVSPSTIEEGDAYSEVSPTTTLFVPGQDQMKHVNMKRDQGEQNITGLDANGTDIFVPSMQDFCQPCEMEPHSISHRFVVCADTQFGITKNNETWQAEMEYSVAAVELINAVNPKPAFVCVCGDLVDMEFSFEKKKGSKSKFPSALFNGASGIASREVCDAIQDEQNADFKNIWSKLDPDIALVCLCGNHDVGNRPTPRSISRFRASYGDEYLAFWTNGSYNIVLNNVLFIDPTGAKRIFSTQLRWLENRLQYATAHRAENIFIFAHHPWFLYSEEEDPEDLTGASPYPEEWSTAATADASFPDSYFSMPKQYRTQALKLFQQYNVTACFSGHFHQNLVSKTQWGMDMIITAPLSLVFESTGKEQRRLNKMMEEEHQDFLWYHRKRRKMSYESEEAMLNNSSMSSYDSPESEMSDELNCRGVRVVDVEVNSRFRHCFVPL